MSDKYDVLTSHFGKFLLQKFSGALPKGPEGQQKLKGVFELLINRLGLQESNYSDFSFLGQGADATAYWCQKDRKKVLKVTISESDAAACMILKKKGNKELLKVYDVIKLPYHHSLYALLVEKLTPLSSAQEKMWDKARDAWESMSVVSRYTGLQEEFLEDLQNAREDAQQGGYPNWAQDIQRVYPILERWAELLTQRGIFWTDIHSGNIMNRGREQIICDFGRSYIKKSPFIPILQV